MKVNLVAINLECFVCFLTKPLRDRENWELFYMTMISSNVWAYLIVLIIVLETGGC